MISILGDGDDAYLSIHKIDKDQLAAMRRNWQSHANEEEIRQRIIDLRLTYDWPALKSAVGICPGSTTAKFRLNDLFNLLDMHVPPGSGFRAPTRRGELQFLDGRRLIGAKNALLMTLIASFYVDYQVCISSKRDVLQKYKDVAVLLGRRMQRRGRDLARAGVPLDTPQFYQGDVGFVSMNYDPILFWVQFIANSELNHSASVPHIGSPAVPLHVFNDFGHLIPSRRVAKGDAESPWYPMNEAVTQRLNESTTGANHRVRLTKVLFPHGCLCWRECPNCGKLSSYHADRWELPASDLLPPPPLLAFDKSACPDRITGKERRARAAGIIDARSCLHCGELTVTNHTQVVMQSSFKPRPPSFIEEIQRDLRAMAMQASHIILMGYSLPPDDVTYRAFFSARSQREGAEPVRCTVVNKDDANPGWYGADELKTRAFAETSAVNAAREVFGENVRFYGGGIPQVFLDGGVATDAKLDRLLEWS
ncbi:MAG TPA: hypothetical protein VLX58_02770 [Bryobacteraceae bacterium]|nr:hypothetical protein [Bryobacteraceae bacterium]